MVNVPPIATNPSLLLSTPHLIVAYMCVCRDVSEFRHNWHPPPGTISAVGVLLWHILIPGQGHTAIRSRTFHSDGQVLLPQRIFRTPVIFLGRDQFCITWQKPSPHQCDAHLCCFQPWKLCQKRIGVARDHGGSLLSSWGWMEIRLSSTTTLSRILRGPNIILKSSGKMLPACSGL